MFSKSTEYAIRAIIYLVLKATPDKLLGAVDIAHELNFPEAFLGKVLQNLVRKKLVVSIKGPGGGYYINKDTLNYTVLQIVEILEGLDFLCKCGLGLHTCSENNPCPIHDDYDSLRDKMRDVLSYKTVNQLKNEIAESNYVMQFELY